jgi:hypothetical protein
MKRPQNEMLAIAGEGGRADPPLDPARQRIGAQQTEPARHLGHRQPARQLQQRQRTALGLGDDPIAHLPIETAVRDRVQERARRRPAGR